MPTCCEPWKVPWSQIPAQQVFEIKQLLSGYLKSKYLLSHYSGCLGILTLGEFRLVHWFVYFTEIVILTDSSISGRSTQLVFVQHLFSWTWTPYYCRCWVVHGFSGDTILKTCCFLSSRFRQKDKKHIHWFIDGFNNRSTSTRQRRTNSAQNAKAWTEFNSYIYVFYPRLFHTLGALNFWYHATVRPVVSPLRLPPGLEVREKLAVAQADWNAYAQVPAGIWGIQMWRFSFLAGWMRMVFVCFCHFSV